MFTPPEAEKAGYEAFILFLLLAEISSYVAGTTAAGSQFMSPGQHVLSIRHA